MVIVVSGRLAWSVFSVSERKQFAPRPATGVHAESLAEMTELANRLLKLVELERAGVCDGQGLWIVYDPIMDAIRKLGALADQRVSNAASGRAG